MIPVNSIHCNRDIGKPKDWTPDKGECVSLPIMDFVQNGINWQCSFWKPDEAELKALNEGKSVSLGVAGISHPVVFVGVADT